jgi:NodT family efflux transporter outer membrane factor (OMF) lipoprotein
MNRTNGIAAALGLVLGGCAVGPDYHAPRSDISGQWSTPLAGGETQNSAELGAWWKRFNDAALDEYIATATGANLTLRAARERVREARAERDAAAGGEWPTLASSATYSRNRISGNSFPSLPGVPLDYNLYTVGFDAVWELDIFGGIRRTVEAATAEVGAAEYARRDLLVSVLAEVARNYIDARAYQAQLGVTAQNVSVQQDVLNLTRSRYESGLSSELDVQEATALLSATQSRVPALEAAFQRSVHHLAVLLGKVPGALLQQMSEVKPIPLTPPTVPVGLPADLLRRRPDIWREERLLAASTARIGVAKAELFPKFSLTGDLGVASTSSSNFLEYTSRHGSIGPTARWNLFEAGRLRANVRVQNARQEQALRTYEHTVLFALEEVENALSAYGKEQQRRESLQRSVQANQRALELSRQLYESGLADFLRVLDSERTLYVTQGELIESERSVSADLVQLYKALGGGLAEE